MNTSRHVFLVLALVLSALFALSASGQAQPVPGICLIRDPAPPVGVPNDGLHSITFNWSINYNTTCATDYKLEILNGALNVVFTKTFPCAPTPIVNGFTWTVPCGQACGCYYARITFFSDWCAGSPGGIEDLAQVSFVVSASGTFQICKFLDLNGNGTKDMGDTPIQGWPFTVEDSSGVVLAMGTTGENGCTMLSVPVNCTGQTTVFVRETLPPGWAKTTQGGVNPFPVVLSSGTNPQVLVGNWQPVFVSGFKYLDRAPWPWVSPEFVGPDGQENPPEFEPLPPCPQADPPNACSSPTQPNQLGIAGVTVKLFDNVNPALPVLLATTVTGADGSYSFGPLQWRQDFKVTIDNPAPSAPKCQPPTEDVGLQPWPGEYFGTVATSPWPCRLVDFVNFHELQITVPQPVVANQVFGCNNFFNNQPSRLFGSFCDNAIAEIPNLTLAVAKDGHPWITPSVNASPAGVYEVPAVSVEQQGLRPGVFRLTPPTPSDPTTQSWEVTTYCDAANGSTTFPLPASGFVDVDVPAGADVRVDFCLISQPNERRCFIPVTFTQQGWHNFCDPASTIIPGGMVYNRFKTAFANYDFFGTILQNKVVIGMRDQDTYLSFSPAGDRTVTFEGTTAALTRLCAFLPQTGACNKLGMSYLNPVSTPAGSLAGETLALQMNIAYNDRRLMPRTSGFDFEKFVIAEGIFKGKTVREVRNIANAVLAGAAPCNFGLSNVPAVGCQQLVDVLAKINANYEFVNFDIFNDRKYLIPNRPFLLPDPPTPVVVP